MLFLFNTSSFRLFKVCQTNGLFPLTASERQVVAAVQVMLKKSLQYLYNFLWSLESLELSY